MNGRNYTKVTICILLLVTMISACAFASAESSGTWGDNLTWTMNDEGTLTFSGSGAMAESYGDIPWHRDSVKALVLGNGITTVGESDFVVHQNLVSVTLPNSIVRIERSAFVYCSKLKTITLPGKVKTIGTGAFAECTGLESIRLPKSVTSIEIDAFNHNSSLKDVYYEGTQADRQKIKIDKYNDDLEKATWHYSQGSAETKDTSVTVGGGKYELTGNGKSAVFTGPEKKTANTLVIRDKVTIGGKSYKVTEIADGACKGMSNVTTLTIGKNITKIGKEAFRKCKKAKTINILTTSLKSVGENAFDGIPKKAVITCPKKKVKSYQQLLTASGLAKTVAVEAKK